MIEGKKRFEERIQAENDKGAAAARPVADVGEEADVPESVETKVQSTSKDRMRNFKEVAVNWKLHQRW